MAEYPTLEEELAASEDDRSAEITDRPLMPQPISAGNSLVRPKKSSARRLAWIAERVELMMGCYRKDDFANPAIFIRAAGAVLEEFANVVIENVTAPRTGIQSEASFPPSLAELKARCLRSEAQLRNIELGKVRRVHAEKPALPPPMDRSGRETMEELRARYPYWLNRNAPDRQKSWLRPLAEIVASLGQTVPASAELKLQLERRAHEDAAEQAAKGD